MTAPDPQSRSADFPPGAVRACVDRVVASRNFVRSHRLTRFLRFMVESRLAGRADELKERTIAMEVYGRRPDYDPRCDPIVRSEAHRLRSKLEAYYARDGWGDPIVIELPKGSYLPEFRRASAQAARPTPCRLAVASFEGPSQQPRKAALALGMRDALVSRLSGRPGLRVTDRRAPQSKSARERGREADFLLEGSLRQVGRRSLLSIRVVRIPDGELLWSDDFPFAWTRVAEVQNAVAERVAGSVGSFLERTGGPRPTPNPSAYEQFLRGHHGVRLYANTQHRAYLEPARRHLLQAVEVEPGFADALADLAFLELQQLYPPQGNPVDLIERAKGYLERALASDPRHARSLFLLGDVHAMRGGCRLGLDLTETAVGLDPDDAEAHLYLAFRYASLGFYESAVAACDDAIRLDSFWDLSHYARAVCLGYSGASAAAVGALEALSRERPLNALGEINLAGLLAARGDIGGAEYALERVLVPKGDTSHLEICRGLVAALRGDEEKARSVLAAHRDSPPRMTDHLIRLSLSLGESEVALRQIVANHFHRNYRWLVNEPLARPFLQEPGFRKLLEELHTQWVRDLAELHLRLPVPPPPVPAPTEVLAAG